jgi:hypothetical protein
MMTRHVWFLVYWLAAVAVLTAAPTAFAEGPDDSGSRGFWAIERDDQRDWIIKIAGAAFWQDIEGHLNVETSVGGVRVSDKTLGLDDNFSGFAEVDLQLFRKHHLRVAAIPMSFKGTRKLDETLEIGGVVLPLQERVETKLKVNTYELSYRYDFYLGQWVTLAPLIQVSAVDGGYDIEAENTGFDWKESQWLPVPAVGLRAEFHLLPRLQVFGEGKGFTIGDKFTVWDVQGGVEIFPIRWFSVLAGYRVIDYDVDWDELVINSRFQGPFVGGALRF